MKLFAARANFQFKNLTSLLDGNELSLHRREFANGCSLRFPSCCTLGRLLAVGFVPHTKTADEGVGVAADPAAGGCLLQLLGVSSADDDVLD